MCRFLLVKSERKFKPALLLKKFALMCQKSRTLEGFRHGDGWGLSLQNSARGCYKSLRPIWQDQAHFSSFPQTSILVVHARSASFLNQRGIIEYNQPYISEKFSFVFNGMLKGVTMSEDIKGKIGAQKIWHLLQQKLNQQISPEQALKDLYSFIKSETKEIKAFNIGLATNAKILALNGQNISSKHFGLYFHSEKNLKIISSEPLAGYKFSLIPQEKVVIL